MDKGEKSLLWFIQKTQQDSEGTTTMRMMRMMMVMMMMMEEEEKRKINGLGSFLFINVSVRNECSRYRNHMSQLFCLKICFQKMSRFPSHCLNKTKKESVSPLIIG